MQAVGLHAEHLVGDAEAEILDKAPFPWPLSDGVGEAAGGARGPHDGLGQSFDTLRSQAADLLDAADPGRALVTWSERLARSATRYDGLPGSVLGALHEPGSSLHASCVGLRGAASDLPTRAQRAHRIRADLDADELLVTVYAMAWAARQANRAAAEGRLPALLVEGLAVR